MWRINYKGVTLQQILIMAYMNIVDAVPIQERTINRT